MGEIAFSPLRTCGTNGPLRTPSGGASRNGLCWTAEHKHVLGHPCLYVDIGFWSSRLQRRSAWLGSFDCARPCGLAPLRMTLSKLGCPPGSRGNPPRNGIRRGLDRARYREDRAPPRGFENREPVAALGRSLRSRPSAGQIRDGTLPYPALLSRRSAWLRGRVP